MTVAVVTDSTACLPPHSTGAAGKPVTVVPLGVTIDGESFTEGIDIDSEAVAQAQRKGLQISTSRPGPATMLAAYERARVAGAKAVVSVHCSAALSSTVASAQLAAAEAKIPVLVIDSQTLGMAMGFSALAGASEAAKGASAEAVADVVRTTAASSVTTFYVDSLDPLKRGGRIGRASALLGSALAIKPLLVVEEGEIAPAERVRTTSRAMGRLVRRTLDAAVGSEPGDVCPVLAVQSLARADLADRVSEDLGAGVPDGFGPLWRVPLGAVVTAHVGAGTVATVVAFPPTDMPDSPT